MQPARARTGYHAVLFVGGPGSGGVSGGEFSGETPSNLTLPAHMKVAVVNGKGGVGKSTTTINLAAALARAEELRIASRGYRTLIVDMDPQASTTYSLTLGQEGGGLNLGHILLEGWHIEEVLRPTATPGLHLIAACEELGDEDLFRQMQREVLREQGRAVDDSDPVPLTRVPGFLTRLRDALTMLETPFDVVLFDCPPGIGLPMTLAMIAGDHFIIPTKLERFALHGTGRLFNFIDRLIELRKRSPEPMAAILGILLTDLNYQFVDAVEREREIRGEYGAAVFETVIRRNVTVERAQDAFRTIFEEDPRLRSTGGQGYRDLAAEVLLRGVGLGMVDQRDLATDVILRGRRLGLLGDVVSSSTAR